MATKRKTARHAARTVSLDSTARAPAGAVARAVSTDSVGVAPASPGMADQPTWPQPGDRPPRSEAEDADAALRRCGRRRRGGPTPGQEPVRPVTPGHVRMLRPVGLVGGQPGRSLGRQPERLLNRHLAVLVEVGLLLQEALVHQEVGED